MLCIFWCRKQHDAAMKKKDLFGRLRKFYAELCYRVYNVYIVDAFDCTSFS